ncbi:MULTISPECIES: ABC-three component system middle component 2 [Burkholderia cepacia complex]|uniref:Threonine transporter RhtB n=1 Tax=Burkholderia ubonensis TaxID=101571 RepID=A0A1B4LIX6_9BURK|nr:MULTISPECIES: ABC-three component system middle component 2 [Burkholderia cepacia complex]AOJ77044.1 threonine transporter RhtB [Burkholderia ubonensis]AOK14142.1 threonine transporter RhtB [Burkholderia vietnamiensis]
MTRADVTRVFNSPFELGFRMVYLLSALRPAGVDLQKLILLDYAVVYSGDLGGPESLHTPVPYRGSELLSRRTLIEQGLHLMSTRGLVTARMDEEGITYVAGPTALSLVGSVTAPYFMRLHQRCEWAARRFGQTGTDALTREFTEQGHRWGAELEGFTLERSGQWRFD